MHDLVNKLMAGLSFKSWSTLTQPIHTCRTTPKQITFHTPCRWKHSTI